MDENSLKKLLAGIPVPEIRYFSTIGSTNDEAIKWALNGAPDGSMVIADFQASGRGRMGRKWITQPGSSLAFSLVLHPSPRELKNFSLLSLLAGIALCQVMKNEYGLESMIKWPNDVLISSRKVCGILVESNWLGDQVQGVIIGIGINVLQGSVPSDENLLFPATSIEAEIGYSIEREKILASFMREFFNWRPQLGSKEFLSTYEKNLAFMHQQVVIVQPEQAPIQGSILGISSKGDLRLDAGNKEILLIKAGDVHVRPINPDQSPLQEENNV
jgi:BirA family biotin operon repressor/biotin-[acetyl-CoA-carboxylase] ligase